MDFIPWRLASSLIDPIVRSDDCDSGLDLPDSRRAVFSISGRFDQARSREVIAITTEAPVARRHKGPVIFIAAVAVACGIMSVSACSEQEFQDPAVEPGAGAMTNATGPASIDGPGSILPSPSGGCEDSKQSAGIQYRSLQHDGIERHYVLSIPDSAGEHANPSPLLIAMHGYGGSGESLRHMIEHGGGLADKFVMLYPDGVGDDNTARGWNSGHPQCCGPALTDNVDDVAFIRDLVQAVSEEVCVDSARVYATGFSNGGDMAQRLACDASDLVAAIASVAGRFDYQAERCPGERPVPAVLYRGRTDRTVPYERGLMSFRAIRTIPAAEGFEKIANNHNCWKDGEVVQSIGDTECRFANGCDAGIELALCSSESAGHCWPGIGNCASSQGIVFSASDHMQEFFARHAVPVQVEKQD